MIKILQGSAVTEIMQGMLITHLLVANSLQHTSAKNYENRLTYVKVTNEDKVGLFIETPCTVDLCLTGSYSR